jgi:hypothetical protein
MRAAQYDLVVEQGATFDLELQYTDNAGQPVDITGMVVRMQGREKIDSTTTLFDWNTPGGTIVLSDPSNGIFKFNVSAAATATLVFDWGYYDLELVDGAVVRRLLEGLVTLAREITR